MKILFTIIMFFVSLFIIDRICLWLENRGWLFYRKNKPQSGALGGALMDLQNVVNPSTRHIIEIKEHKIETEHCDDDKDKNNI